MIITGDAAYRVIVRKMDTYEIVMQSVLHNDIIWCMLLDSSESLLFTGSEDTSIRLTDLGYRKSLGVLNGHTS